MKAERTHILQMVADGKITVEEAEKLLEAIEPNSAGETSQACGEGEVSSSQGL